MAVIVYYAFWFGCLVCIVECFWFEFGRSANEEFGNYVTACILV